MGEAALVEQDAYEGALLIEKLDSDEFHLTAAFWAHDVSLDIWRLVLAASRLLPHSRREIYQTVQRVLIDLDLHLELGRISIIADTDPIIGTLREFAATSINDTIEVPLGGAEVAGASVDVGYAYRVEGLRYERELLAALQRNQPDDAVLRQSSRITVSYAFNFDFDFVLDNGAKMAFIVAKSFPRALTEKDIQRISIPYQNLKESRPESTLIIVSRTGFVISAGQALPAFGRMSEIRLTKWASSDDDAELRTSLGSIFG